MLIDPLLFRIYDMDNDGYISNGELYQVKVKAKDDFLFTHKS